MKKVLNILLSILLISSASCNKEEDVVKNIANNTLDSSKLKGTSEFIFTSFTPLSNKPIKVYFHIPTNSTPTTPILFVLHGNERDALFSRNQLIVSANQLNFMVVAPEFNEKYYPGGDAFNLGNIFIDGDNPSPQTLNAENNWTFSAIEPIFEYFKLRTGSLVSTFDMFGHSAGGQFAHRFLLFKPMAKLNKIVVASSGWYTMFDNTIDFPYGTKKSPAELSNYGTIFNKKVYVIIGANDTDPNSDALRHNDIVDKQGLNRLQRAQYFYTQSRNTAAKTNASFNWEYSVLPKVDHDFTATSAAGAALLYN
ncbi:MAG: hypothetical protein ACEQSR_06470 [Candidatus Methylacidiphilales bacterium]